jgi:hypothetical protein
MSHACCLFYKLHIGCYKELANVSAFSLGPLSFVKLPNRVNNGIPEREEIAYSVAAAVRSS